MLPTILGVLVLQGYLFYRSVGNAFGTYALCPKCSDLTYLEFMELFHWSTSLLLPLHHSEEMSDVRQSKALRSLERPALNLNRNILIVYASVWKT